MKIQYKYIDAFPELLDLGEKLGKENIIALDLEFDHNSFSYGLNICLAQVATEKGEIFLIDPLAIDDLEPLLKVLKNPKLIKVMHSASEDAMVIRELGGELNHVFDTEKVCRLLGDEQTGLGDQLQNRFGLEIEKGLQRSNWNKRPLSKDLLDYAAQDVLYLIRLREDQIEQSKTDELFDWIAPVLSDWETELNKEKPKPPLKVKGMKELEPEERKKARALLLVREEFAAKNDKPPYMILSNQIIVNVAKNGIPQKDGWRKIGGLSPWAKDLKFYERLSKILADGVPELKTQKVFVKPHVFKKRTELLEQLRINIENKGGLAASRVALSKGKINDIALSGDLTSLNQFFLEMYPGGINELKSLFPE